MKVPKLSIKNEKVKKVLNALNKKWIKVVVILLAVFGLISIGLNRLSKNVQEAMSQIAQGQSSSAVVSYQTISSNISSTGTVEPLDTYNVTALVDGEVMKADFEEGDQVVKDQVLYEIDTDDVTSKIDTAQTNAKRAQRHLNQAVKDYNEAKDLYDDLKVKAGASGQITELSVEKGDVIAAGSPIGKITDNNTMVLKIPFNSEQTGPEMIGKTAVITLQDTMETLSGTVTEVNQVESVLTGGRLVKMVKIEVPNPGGLTTSHGATAVIEAVASSDAGTFKPVKEKSIISKGSGEIVAVHVKAGDTVSKDQVLLELDKKAVDKQIDAYQQAVDTARDSVEDASTAIEDLNDNLDNYLVKAPISGQIINKKVKVGDKLSLTSNLTVMAVIYDMSAFRFKMSIDELDIHLVKVGQEVAVTADALPGKTLKGKVETISLESTNNNGITQYPVTVRIDEIGDLLPGMTVNGEIIVGTAENVLTIPSMALMRGNVVYVKDDSVLEAVGEIPAGYREVKVEVGIANDQYVEILSGLSEGDEVYVKPRVSSNVMDMMYVE